MISHVFVGITDFNRAFQFYSAIMEELGLQLKFSDAKSLGLFGYLTNRVRCLLSDYYITAKRHSSINGDRSL